MNPDGDIRQIPDGEQPRADEIVIPRAQLPRVQKMNRHDRRAWYATEQKRLRQEAREDATRQRAKS